MFDSTKYKIKDSVDLFLSNETYLMAYYMNARQRKSFKINNETVHLLEMIDGKTSLAEIKERIRNEFDVDPTYVDKIIGMMLKNRIVAPVLENNVCLNEEDSNRYTRQINYFSEFLDNDEMGIKAQGKLMISHVIIFGCGAIGGNIALELVMAGVRNITLYDEDVVEISDVSRHMFFSEKYVGQKKTEALRAELLRVDSKVNVICIDEYMRPTTDVEYLIKDKDFVVNTLDEPYIGYTSSKISRICVKYKIPHFIAGGFDAHLASTGELIIPYITPCVECYAGHFKVKLKNWKPKKHPVVERFREIGGLASMSLFSSSYACIEIIKVLAGIIEMKENYKVRGEFLFPDMSLTYLDVKKNPKCPICGGVEINESEA